VERLNRAAYIPSLLPTNFCRLHTCGAFYEARFLSRQINLHNMSSSISFLDAIVKRRSAYSLTSTSLISQERIKELVHESLKYCPTACEYSTISNEKSVPCVKSFTYEFLWHIANTNQVNVRSSYCILLFRAEHAALWDHAADITPKTIPAHLVDLFVPRIALFRPAYGTISLSEHIHNSLTLIPHTDPLLR
jgi:predicted oxidoreductase (fatty acid repression mutant protein)